MDQEPTLNRELSTSESGSNLNSFGSSQNSDRNVKLLNTVQYENEKEVTSSLTVRFNYYDHDRLIN